MREKIRQIVETSSLYHLSSALWPYRDEIFKITSLFPETVTLSIRARAIAADDPCACLTCGKVHGKLGKRFCSRECQKQCTLNKNHAEKIKKAISVGEETFAGKEEGVDYLVCKICGCKHQELSNHLKIHNYTPKQYKAEFGISSVKIEKRKLRGADNPAYQHGGKYSPWSKNFIHGYDAERHEASKAAHSKFQKNNSKNVFRKEAYDSDEEYLAFQTKNLEFFINKYGVEEGTRRHAEKTTKWLATMEAKSPEEILEINRKKVWKGGYSSKAEIELFEKIKEAIPNAKHQIMIKNEVSWYLYDIVVGKRIIEYNGDFWHANPNKFKAESTCYNGLTAKEIWEKDLKKIETAQSNGYEILVVWESDYKNNPTHAIQQCLDFLHTT